MMKSSLQNDDTAVDAPAGLGEVFSLRQEGSMFIAGGTLLQLNWEAGQQKPHHLISSHRLESLQGIEEEANFLRIGASALLSDCILDSNIQKRAKILAEACTKIAAPAVRNRGTLGGNICSRVGDSIPALLVLDAQLHFFNGVSTYVVPLSQWIKAGPLTEPDLLVSVNIPLSTESRSISFFQKIGRRESFTAAIISSAGRIEMENGVITDAKMAIGGGAHQPQRLSDAESYVLQKSLKTMEWQVLRSMIEHGFHSYSDPFVTDSYRRKAAANIIVANLYNLLNSEYVKEDEGCD
ncbi:MULTISPECIES: FAD binding domain-containing protein [unclassified Niallia]|uniref:FAD binding domain-containing protein n=1 Tax=unclassified Niallia TaxID=2837522 RepID=UPI001EDB8A95|nr:MULTISPECIES: FAD binding domain-containing protein [unclassified Niallia]MDL0434843.1 FAD binding domain-containing protein [Niallia sp. SS-2023]UPO89338.1 FAD binding domain-containing protein [Niallia sp. Man26]